jgi:hypothetical protein
MSEVFNDKELELEDYWRAIILRGRNVASYKFALAKTLLDLKPESGQLIKIGELAPLFSSHIAEHLKKANKQGNEVFEFMRRLVHVGNFLQCAGIIQEATFVSLNAQGGGTDDPGLFPVRHWHFSSDLSLWSRRIILLALTGAR